MNIQEYMQVLFPIDDELDSEYVERIDDYMDSLDEYELEQFSEAINRFHAVTKAACWAGLILIRMLREHEESLN